MPFDLENVHGADSLAVVASKTDLAEIGHTGELRLLHAAAKAPLALALHLVRA